MMCDTLLTRPDHAVDRPIVTSPKKVSEAIENTSIGRSHGLLTGPIFSRALDRLHSLDLRSARGKDWPVNRPSVISLMLTSIVSLTLIRFEDTPLLVVITNHFSQSQRDRYSWSLATQFTTTLAERNSIS